MNPSLNMPATPPAAESPQAVADADAALLELVHAYNDLTEQNRDVLADDWQDRAAAKDRSAARAAAERGEHPPERSHLDDAARERPRVQGRLDSIEARAREATRQVQLEVVNSAHEGAVTAGARLAEAEQRLVDAAAELEAAQMAWGHAIRTRLYWHTAEVSGAVPKTAPQQQAGIPTRVAKRNIDPALPIPTQVKLAREALAQINCEPTPGGGGTIVDSQSEPWWRIKIKSSGKVVDEPRSRAEPKVEKFNTAELIEVLGEPDQEQTLARAQEHVRAL